MRLKTRIVALLAIAMLSLGLVTNGVLAEDSDTTVITTTVTLEGPPPSGMCTVSVPGGNSVTYSPMQKIESGYTDGSARIDLELGQTYLPGGTAPCNLEFEIESLEARDEQTNETIGTIRSTHLVVFYYENPDAEVPTGTYPIGIGQSGAKVRIGWQTAQSQPARLDLTIKGEDLIAPPGTYSGTVTLTASQGQ